MHGFIDADGLMLYILSQQDLFFLHPQCCLATHVATLVKYQKEFLMAQDSILETKFDTAASQATSWKVMLC